MILTIAYKEFRSQFALPSNWFILAALQVLFAWFYLGRMDAFLQVQAQLAQLANAPGATQAVAVPLFGSLGLILMMLVPVLTMRAFAEERRSHTLALLLSAPVSDAQIVFGKFLGLMFFLTLIVAVGTGMVLTLGLGTHLDFGLIASNALGLLLMAACYAALGLYLSALTAQPVVAAIGTLSLLFGSWLLEASAPDQEAGWRALAPTSHFQSLNNGLLHSGDLAYFLLFCAAFLLLTARRLQTNRLAD
jgi:ABC-2 type transport system permease protein